MRTSQRHESLPFVIALCSPSSLLTLYDYDMMQETPVSRDKHMTGLTAGALLPSSSLASPTGRAPQTKSRRTFFRFLRRAPQIASHFRYGIMPTFRGILSTRGPRRNHLVLEWTKKNCRKRERDANTHAARKSRLVTKRESEPHRSVNREHLPLPRPSPGARAACPPCKGPIPNRKSFARARERSFFGVRLDEEKPSSLLEQRSEGG